MIRLSASELGKYAYCPLQWYYTRLYGEKALRAKYRELHPDRGGENPAFARGRTFHRLYAGRERLRRAFRISAVLFLLVLGLFIAYRLCFR